MKREIKREKHRNDSRYLLRIFPDPKEDFDKFHQYIKEESSYFEGRVISLSLSWKENSSDSTYSINVDFENEENSKLFEMLITK